MEIQCWQTGQYVITFNDKEKEFMKREAKENSITVLEMFYNLFGLLVVGGYKVLTGKDK